MPGSNPAIKGSKYERELVLRLRDAGYGALRLPSSGSATERELPDVLAGGPMHLPGHAIAGDDYADEDWHTFSRLKAIELKAAKADIIYLDAAEIDALRSFANTWGATAYIGIRSTQQATPTATYLVPPDDARRTDAGRYAVDVDGVGERAAVVVGDDGVEEG